MLPLIWHLLKTKSEKRYSVIHWWFFLLFCLHVREVCLREKLRSNLMWSTAESLLLSSFANPGIVFVCSVKPVCASLFTECHCTHPSLRGWAAHSLKIVPPLISLSEIFMSHIKNYLLFYNLNQFYHKQSCKSFKQFIIFPST